MAEPCVTEAQVNFGVMYERGQGVRQDFAKVARWHRKTATLGYDDE